MVSISPYRGPHLNRKHKPPNWRQLLRPLRSASKGDPGGFSSPDRTRVPRECPPSESSARRRLHAPRCCPDRLRQASPAAGRPRSVRLPQSSVPMESVGQRPNRKQTPDYSRTIAKRDSYLSSFLRSLQPSRLSDNRSGSDGRRAGVERPDARDRRSSLAPMLDVAYGRTDPGRTHLDLDCGVEIRQRPPALEAASRVPFQFGVRFPEMRTQPFHSWPAAVRTRSDSRFHRRPPRRGRTRP